MSKQAAIEAVRTLLLAHSPINSNLSQLTRGYAYPYDTTPEPITRFPCFIVERRRTLPAYSEAIGAGCYLETMPIRVDVVLKEYLIDTDRPNIDAIDERKALDWEDEMHVFFHTNYDLGGVIIDVGQGTRVETQVGRRYWYQQELFTTAVFLTATYEVVTS